MSDNEQKAKSAEELVNYSAIHIFDDEQDGMEMALFIKSHAVEMVEDLQSQNEKLQNKLNHYRDEVDKIRQFTFDNSLGLPNQNIFEAVSDRIKELEQQVSDLETALIITKNSRKTHIEKNEKLVKENEDLKRQLYLSKLKNPPIM